MNEIVEIRVPEIGDFSDVPVVEILVAPGDMVESEQSLLSVESDKATLDIPASAPGEIIEMMVSVGDTVSEGSLIARLRATSGAAEMPAEEAAPPVEAPADKAVPAPVLPVKQPDAVTAAPQTAADGRSHATPSLRKFARELGVDLSRVAGTGPKGRITREDVTGFVKSAMDTPSHSRGGFIDQGLPDWPQVDYGKYGPVERRQLSRITRISGPSLARNSMLIPHVTNFDTADITDLEAFRKTVNAENADGAKISILPFVVKAVVAALKAYPQFNSSLDGEELVVKNYYHIGVAADTPEGLVVPVVRDADKKGVQEIALEMAALAATARQGKLKPADMQGGTFTISSLGGIGGTNFTPIINAPEVAILGMTRAAIQPVWDGTDFQPRLVQPLSLSWDHRVVDGVAAAKFLKTVQAVLTDFRRNSL